MTAVLVDSNILLDLTTEDPRWMAWSTDALAQAADRHRLVINQISSSGACRRRRVSTADRDASHYQAYFPRLSLITPG